MGSDALGLFSDPVRAWFSTTFPEPTQAQAQGWPAIAAGSDTLVLAPTGSGKTLAAFLWGIDRLVTQPPPTDRTRRTRLLYLSPLRALAVDVERNLRAPLAGVRLAAERLAANGAEGERSWVAHEPTVAVRTGDTPASERRSQVRTPADLLITTPESLYLLLTSAARDTLRGVEAVIIDEIHVLAGTKRGAHLALSLERLAARCDRPPQRIGLSATQRPLEEVARFLGGHDDDGQPRPVRIIDAGSRKPLAVEVVVPVPDMADLSVGATPPASAPGPDGPAGPLPAPGPTDTGPTRRSIWPSLHPRLLEVIHANRSTLVFVNARRLAERLATRLNELDAGDVEAGNTSLGRPPTSAPLVLAHHGSISRTQRLTIEDDLKAGRVRGLVATSSLELGIDMGAVDQVVLVGSPGAVSRGLQRIGRAGHQVGAPSRGTILPSHRADLLETAALVPAMHAGAVEATRVPRNPLDVLAQQIVAMVALDDWSVDELARLVRRAAPFHDLGDEVLAAVLDLLDGRYPAEQFAELRPRLVWNRAEGVLRARSGAQRIAVVNGGTIPDRGLYGVFLPDGTRVGELDEEMVYESRPGETFLLGASTWRIDDITHDRVIVTPAPGSPGTVPFWHGDGPGRPIELGRAMGAMVRRLRTLPHGDAAAVLRDEAGFDDLAAHNLLAYLSDQSDATTAVPDDRTVVVERFRDDLGDWRVCILTPFGSQVHAPWGMAIRHVLAEDHGLDADVLWSDDGIAIRLPEAVDELPRDALWPGADKVRELVIAALPGTALFASRFREAAARALLLPRRQPGQRTPLWQQRRRAADLLAVAAAYPSFPILLEVTRECLHDTFDVPALEELLRGVASRQIHVVEVDTARSSPWAQSLVFDWMAAHLYDGDAPLAERRLAALSLDRDLLAELLGSEELRDLLDPGVLAATESELQRLAGPAYPARDADAVHDLLRVLGPLSRVELLQRVEVDAATLDRWLGDLVGEHRAIAVAIAGHQRLAAAADAGRLRDGLGVAIPIGLPSACTEPAPHGAAELVERYARTHGPFLAAEVADRLGLPGGRAAELLAELLAAGRVVHAELRPGGTQREWCDVDVLRRLRQRTLAALRHEVEPVDAEAFARFLPAWQGIGAHRRGLDALAEAVASLQGVDLPASVLETEVLPARVDGYRPGDLDELCASGEVVWRGAGPLGARDGRLRLFFAEQADVFGAVLPIMASDGAVPSDPMHGVLRAHLRGEGASFFDALLAAAVAGGLPAESAAVADALWDLVWAGEVTNDTLAPVRAHLRDVRRGAGRPPGRPRPGRLRRIGPADVGGRWSLADRGATPATTPSVAVTEGLHALAWQLLERHGVLTREAVLAEGVPGGFAAVYPVLRALEERGRVRRGYFVAGLGAAQFALPGAVDRLRAARDTSDRSAKSAPAVLLAATDPAQPFGAALPWPATEHGRPARAAGARVILCDGKLLAFLERGGRRLVTFGHLDDEAARSAFASALRAGVAATPRRSMELVTIDGAPARTHSLAATLEAVGFVGGYRGLVLRVDDLQKRA